MTIQLHKTGRAILGESANEMVESAIGREKAGLKCSSSTRAQVDIWSTGSARAHERFSYWRDAVCRAVFGISIEAPPERFSARIAARTHGPLRFARSESTCYQLVRDRRDIASAPADHYSIYLQVSGQTVTALGDETFEFNAGDIGIYDGRQPFHAFHGGCRAIAVLPGAMIDRQAPWLRRDRPRKLGAGSPYTDLIRRHLLELSDPDSPASETAIGMLTENLCNLVALSSATNVEPNRLRSELQIEALLAFCRQNLHNAELSPRLAADYLGISIRTLHLRFKQIGETFGRWVLHNRLEACRTALGDPNQRSFNISEIAYRWGFNDLSYFNKCFRARFDMTPREWRYLQASAHFEPGAVSGRDD